MNALILLLTITTSTLVLRSGDRIKVEGPVTEENGVVTFRADGLLYSVPASEVVTRTSEAPETVRNEAAKPVRRLVVSAEERDRRLRELEKNHDGKPIAQPELRLPPPPTKEELAEMKREEREWRERALAHDEAVRRAKEELQLLHDRIERLEGEIRTFFSLGYEPRQFTYQTSRLVLARERIPAAQLEVERAERAREQFREEARREGILPGWYR